MLVISAFKLNKKLKLRIQSLLEFKKNWYILLSFAPIGDPKNNIFVSDLV